MAEPDAPYEIVTVPKTGRGDHASAVDMGGALLAARTLRDDYRGSTSGGYPTTHILFEGEHVLTIDPTRSI